MKLNIFDNKTKIIYNSTLLFYNEGYKKTTLRKIAESTGIKHSSIFNHFKGKRELGEVVLAKYYEKLFNYSSDNYKKVNVDIADGLQLLFYYFNTHFHLILNDKNYLMFYIEILVSEDDILENILPEYVGLILGKSFAEKEKINELEMHLNINALSSIEKVLIKNYINREVSIEEVIIYFTKFFIKIMYGKDILSRHQIKEYAKKFIEFSDYSTVDIYREFLS